mmetsp:Transcript_32776/g.85764  ORF Transcript_32776/g.85764 Transcript_32776/m.85764 type:complete len:278 (-) Transcript_32776:357-1190(-)
MKRLGIVHHDDGNKHRLPEGHEDDPLDDNCLHVRVRRQKCTGIVALITRDQILICVAIVVVSSIVGVRFAVKRKVKEHQAVERPRLGRTVQDRNVHIAFVEVKRPLAVLAKRLRNECKKRAKKTTHDVRHGAGVHPEKKLGPHHPWRQATERKNVFGWRTRLNGIGKVWLLLPHVCEQVHIEIVNYVSFVTFTPCVEVDRHLVKPQRDKGIDSIDGHHPDAADDVSLKLRVEVILNVLCDLEDRDRDRDRNKYPCRKPRNGVWGAPFLVELVDSPRE